MLRQAMASRRALLLLDGLDEGGEKREQIERHVTEVLAPQGHILLATSRPDGIKDERYAKFRRLKLKSLSVDQQKQALEQRLGAERASPLLPYLERMPVDEQTQERITANPLMLSMVSSIFELRSGLAMPETVVDLYTQATSAMLGRAGGGSAGELAPLLQAVFFEAQSDNGSRVIKEKHLRAAVQRVDDGERSLKWLKELALAERMPLLSLLKARPLELQSAHLSIQEYYAARAICEGARLPKPPWELSVSWANTVRLGLDMGNDFTLVRLLDALRDLNAQCTGASKSAAKKASAGAAGVLETIADQASPPLAEEIRRAAQELRRQKGPMTIEQLNRVAVPLVRAAGATGWREYEAGQELSIRIDGQWIDAELVGVVEPNRTRLRMHEGRDGVQELHPWNHALRELPSADFHEALNEWKTSMCARTTRTSSTQC
jgi:hypothetical protein